MFLFLLFARFNPARPQIRPAPITSLDSICKFISRSIGWGGYFVWLQCAHDTNMRMGLTRRVSSTEDESLCVGSTHGVGSAWQWFNITTGTSGDAYATNNELKTSSTLHHRLLSLHILNLFLPLQIDLFTPKGYFVSFFSTLVWSKEPCVTVCSNAQ